ncbi:Uncharacterised protein [Serratia marcescens]|nr:Uncharacterised protein [Serratia marcescens]
MRISAVLTLMMAAAPKPCSTRAMVSVSSESDRAQNSEVMLNTSSPA